jgi:hypothetical protein
MLQQRSLAIDIIKFVPENSICYINAPNFYNDSQIMYLLEKSNNTDWQVTLTNENKDKLIEIINLEKIEGAFEYAFFQNDDLLVTIYDGFCTAVISNKIKFPDWFLDKYSDCISFE